MNCRVAILNYTTMSGNMQGEFGLRAEMICKMFKRIENKLLYKCEINHPIEVSNTYE